VADGLSCYGSFGTTCCPRARQDCRTQEIRGSKKSCAAHTSRAATTLHKAGETSSAQHAYSKDSQPLSNPGKALAKKKIKNKQMNKSHSPDTTSWVLENQHKSNSNCGNCCATSDGCGMSSDFNYQQLNEAPFTLIIPATLLFWFLWSAAHSHPRKLPTGHKVKTAPTEKQLGIVLFFICSSTAVNHTYSVLEINYKQQVPSPANVKTKQSQLWYLQPAEQGKQIKPLREAQRLATGNLALVSCYSNNTNSKQLGKCLQHLHYLTIASKRYFRRRYKVQTQRITQKAHFEGENRSHFNYQRKGRISITLLVTVKTLSTD